MTQMPLDAGDQTPEEVLLAAFARGDQQAAAALSSRFAPLAFRYAMRLLGNRADAEDVAQDALMRLWKVAPDWRAGEAAVSTWLYRVVSNLCMDRLRQAGRSVEIDAVADQPDGTPSVETGMIETDRAAALTAALAQLPVRQKQAVVLRHIEGLSNPEIAQVMDIGVEAVESLTARGKRALTGLLAPRSKELGYGDDG